MKPITLRYEINGVKMKRTYANEDFEAAKVRAAMLVKQGIRVVLTNTARAKEPCRCCGK